MSAVRIMYKGIPVMQLIVKGKEAAIRLITKVLSFLGVNYQGDWRKIEKTNPEAIERILAVDWISIFLFYKDGSSLIKQFRLKWREGRIRMAARYGFLLPDWQGYICEKKEPTLHLKKLDNKKVNLEIPIPCSHSPKDSIVIQDISFGKVMVVFSKHWENTQIGSVFKYI